MIVIGLDGATFKILDKLLEENVMPTLKMMIKNGVKADLKSVFPPITGPAWCSLATGKNPGKTGVFDFRNLRDKNSYKLKSINSQTFRDNITFWDILSDNNLQTGIYNYPFLYPPYKINGFMTSGTGSGPEQDITYPKELKNELKEASEGKYEIQVPYAEKRYRNKPDEFVKDTKSLLEINKSHIQYLLKKDFEVFVMVINASDFAQHYLWKYLEDNDNKYKKEFEDIWKEIDNIIKIVYNEFPDENYLFVSDHGFGPNKQTFYVNTWLEENNYLVRKKDPTTTLWFKLQKKIGNVISFVGKFFPSIARRLWNAGEKRTKPFIEKIDLEKSKAFSLPQSLTTGQIWLNKKNLNKHQVKKVKSNLVNDLNKFFSENNMTFTYHEKEDIYKGDKTHFAPDILFKVNDFECSAPYPFKSKILVNKPDNPNRTGAHKRNGIFIASGPDIKENIEKDVFEIYDIAPTILHMNNLPIPEDMDGRVLKEIFREDSEFAKRKAKKEKNIPEEKKKLDNALSKLTSDKNI